MKIFSPYKRITLLTAPLVNMLIFTVIMIGFFISPSQHSLAQKVLLKQETMNQTLTATKRVKQVFKDFCTIYYFFGPNRSTSQETRTCQNQSSAFASLVLNESPKGSQQWGIKLSLDDLAKQNLLTKNEAPIQNEQDFINSITNRDLKALIRGSGNNRMKFPQDSQFLPNLWKFKLVSSSTTTPTPTPSSITPSTPSPQLTITISTVSVTCSFTPTLTCMIT